MIETGDLEGAFLCSSRLLPSSAADAGLGDLPAIHDLLEALLASGRGSSSLARAWAETEVALARSTGDATLLVFALRDQGGVEIAEGRSAEAAETLRSAVSLARSIDEPALLIDAMLDLAEAASRAGQFDEVAAVLDEAESQAHFSVREESLARAWQIRAFAFRAQGDATAAEPSILEAVALRDRLDSTHPDTALAYQELGELLTFQGRHEEARVAFRRAVEIFVARLGPKSPRLARAWGRLAGAERHCGDLAASIEAHQKGLQIALDQLGPDDIETTARLNDFAITRVVEGDYSSARTLYGQALDRALELPEPERSQYAATMNYNLGEVATLAGDFDEAYDRTSEACAMWKSSVGPSHPFVALALEQLAEIERRRGQRGHAEELVTEALTIRLAAQGPEHPATAACARQAGELAVERSDVAAARRAMMIALRAAAGPHAVRPSEAARIQTLVARVSFLERTPQTEALTAALDADDIYREDLRQAVRYLAEGDGLTLAADSPQALDLALSIAASRRPSVELSRRLFDAVVRSRSLVLDTTAARAHSAAAAPEELLRRSELDLASRNLASLIYRGPSGSLDLFARQVEEARGARDRAERDLALANADFRRELEVEGAGFAEIAGALPAGTALVSLVRYEPPTIGRRDPTAAYLALVTRPGAVAPRLVPLGAAVSLERAIDTWSARAHDLDGALGGGRSAEVAYRKAARPLTDRLWRPIAEALGEVQRVFIVADGLTQTVSLAALPTTAGRYLLETGPRIHYLAAERDLLRFREPGLSGGSAMQSLLAVGAPSYDADGDTIANAEAPAAEGIALGPGTLIAVGSEGGPDLGGSNSPPARSRGRRSSCGGLDQLRFAGLPEAGTEARAVANLWAARGAGPAQVLTGAAANIRLFASLAPARRVLHLATHGFFLGNDCGTRGEVARKENPMLLSGLAFAGANRRQRNAGEGDDGILTAEEIAGLPLAGVEWVVLSACDTGQGRIANREGVLGLRRAFSVAGARTLVTSLWPVDDAHARAWMIGLYSARLTAHADTIEAATSASRTLIDDLRTRTGTAHPALWAPWVTSGDWR